MFNIFEGDTDAKVRKLQERLEILRRAREDGFFDEKRTEPIPEIIADGKGPDDRVRPSPFVKNQAPPEHGERCPHAGGNALEALPKPQETTRIWCHNCDAQTNHNSYGRGSPTWHCNICCTCDWCMASVERKLTQGRSQMTRIEQGMAQIEHAREELERAVHEAPEEQYFFCTKCGAALRCTTCRGEGTGSYCDLCGKKTGEEGFCTDCWKEEDKDG